MKAFLGLKPITGFSTLLALAALVFSGCSTTKKVDWDSRVGSFTYDQAIAELGPPDKQTKLSDGKTVADWITRRSGGVSFGVGTGVYGSHSAVGGGVSTGSGYQDRVLRLTFDPQGRLAAWSKNH